jgi:DNA-binding MarR family transcriptional regulator
MGEALKKKLKMKRQPPLREELSLNISIVSSLMRSRFEKMLLPYGITPVQYNVLRILKGVYPEGHARCEIISRMVDSSPDITRLIDRLEKQELVVRDRTSGDRRMSITRITEKGIKLIDELMPVFESGQEDLTKNLDDKECAVLSKLIEKLYEDMI